MDWQAKYYKKKFGGEEEEQDEAARLAIVTDYVQGLAWVLHYYYDGVPSWKWYFPHYYAPLLQDLKGLDTIDLNFDLGEPFQPLQQLMGVLPVASAKRFLPKVTGSQ